MFSWYVLPWIYLYDKQNYCVSCKTFSENVCLQIMSVNRYYNMQVIDEYFNFNKKFYVVNTS